MRGFAALPLVIFLVVVAAAGIGWHTFSTRQPTKVEISPTPSPSPTSTPTPKPTVKPTLKPTVKPSPTPTSLPTSTPAPAAAATATPETPKTGCAEYNPGGDLGSLKVTIQPEAGKSLVGDAGVKIYRKYEECKGVDPGFPLTQIIKQGSSDTTFSGMRPGPFKIDVNYHGKTSTHDAGINSGDNSMTATVSD